MVEASFGRFLDHQVNGPRPTVSGFAPRLAREASDLMTDAAECCSRIETTQEDPHAQKQ
jgi:hypothetical protein